MTTTYEKLIAERWKWSFAATVIVALLFRLWGTWYGLPFSYYNDEYHEVMRALQLGAGSFNFDRTSKGGFYFLLFLEYGAYFVWLKLTGAVQSTHEFALLYARDPSMFYLLGRIMAAVIGSLTVGAVFLLTRQAYTLTAGILAALFIAFNVLHVDLSRRIGVDVPMVLMSTLSLYFAVRVATDGRRADYLLAALCAAIAVTTKLPAILLLLPLLMAHTYYAARSGDGFLRAWLTSRSFWLASLVFVLVVVATNPGILAKSGYLSLFTSLPASQASVAMASDLELTDMAVRPNLFLYYFSAIQESMGWPLFLFGLISVMYALWKRTAPDLLLVAFALANYLVISSTTSEWLYYPRYALPIIIVLAALSGRMLAEIICRLPTARVLAFCLATVGLLVIPVTHAVINGAHLMQPDNRTAAKEWFEANVPAGSRVLIEGGWIYPLRETVQLTDTHEALKRRIAYWEVKDPRQARYLEYRLAAHPGIGFELVLVPLDEVGTLEEYAMQGVEYFVVRPHYFLKSRKAGPGAAKLINELRSNERVKLIKKFEGDPRSALSPSVEIYQLLPEQGGPDARGKQ